MTSITDTNVNPRKQEMASDLTLILDGERRDLMTFLETEGEKTYPRIGERTYRVPPVSFQPERRIQARNTADGYILDSPIETDLQKNLAEETVYGAFERLSDRLLSEGKGPLFIIVNFEFDNYLNKIDLSLIPSQKEGEKADENNEANCNNPCGDDGGAVSGNEESVKDGNDMEDEERADSSSSSPAPSTAPTPLSTAQEPKLCKKNAASSPIKRPRDMADRGEMDGLLLHQKAGVILLEIKAVGHNFSSLDRSVGMDPRVNIATAVTKAVNQVKRDHVVMEHVMGGIGLTDEHMTSMIALPNLTRQLLRDVYDDAGRKHLMEEYGLDLDVNFLCTEDFTGSGLYEWWENVLMTNLKMEAELDLGLMKNIAYRTVGLLSTVSVWSVKEPRMEVRNLHDATVATANCFTQLIISSQQAAVLKREDRYLYIWGTSGSGKTLLLALKGRQWLRRHRSVVILNTRLGSEGRVVGREMMRAINKSPGLPRQAECVDFDLEHDLSVLKTKLATCNLPANKPTCFLFDEVTWKSQTIQLMAMLRQTYPECSIWCAGMLEEFCLPGFEKQHLEDVLRCPPWVQRVLRVIDNNRKRAKHYHTDNLKIGLATNGLRPYFVIHSHHGGDPNVETIDCVECARLVADYLKNTLKIKHPAQQPQAQDEKNVLPKDSDQPATSHHSIDKTENEPPADKKEGSNSNNPVDPSSLPLSPTSSAQQTSATPPSFPSSVGLAQHSKPTPNIPEEDEKPEGDKTQKKRRKPKAKKSENPTPPSPSSSGIQGTNNVANDESVASETPSLPTTETSVPASTSSPSSSSSSMPPTPTSELLEDNPEQDESLDGERAVKKKRKPRGKKKGDTASSLSSSLTVAEEGVEDVKDEHVTGESPATSPTPAESPSTIAATTPSSFPPSSPHSESNQLESQNNPEGETQEDEKALKKKKRPRGKKKASTTASSSLSTHDITGDLDDDRVQGSSLSPECHPQQDAESENHEAASHDSKNDPGSKTCSLTDIDYPGEGTAIESTSKTDDPDGAGEDICSNSTIVNKELKNPPKNKRGRNKNKNSSSSSVCENAGGGGSEKSEDKCAASSGKNRNRTRSVRGSGSVFGGESKSEGSEEGLRYSDVVIPITMPREWHHLNDMRYYSISGEALAQNMIFMGSSPFCRYLLENDVPLKVEMAMRLTIEGKEEQDQHLIMCPGGAVHGLEYKVVIALPTGCSTPENKDFNYGVLQGELGEPTRMELTEFGKKLLKDQKERARRNLGSITTDPAIFNMKHNGRRLGVGSGVDGRDGIGMGNARSKEEYECDLSIDGIRIATHVEGDPENDVIYRNPLNDGVGGDGGGDDGGGGDGSGVRSGVRSSGKEEKREGIGTGGGEEDDNAEMTMRPTAEKPLLTHNNVPTSAPSSLLSSTLAELSAAVSTAAPPPANTEVPPIPPPPPRPLLSSPPSTSSLTFQDVGNADHLQKCGFCDTDYCVCAFFEGHELAALNRMRPWEKAYILMTASRCTASLIMVLP